MESCLGQFLAHSKPQLGSIEWIHMYPGLTYAPLKNKSKEWGAFRQRVQTTGIR